MTKLEEIKKACKEKNIDFELHDIHSYKKIIGIRFGRYSWHWFMCDAEETSLLFQHTYSQNTGKTTKGLKHSMKVYKLFEKKLSIKI